MPDDPKPKTLSEVLTGLKKRHGDGIVCTPSESRISSLVPRLSTGVFMLDWATGGGFPIGRFVMIKGDEGAGKSTIALRVITAAQQTCRYCYATFDPEAKSFPHASDCEWEKHDDESTTMRVVYVDIEGTFLNSWAQTVGVDLGDMHLSQPEMAEQAIDIIQELLVEGVVDLVVLDSVASMSNQAELSKSVEDTIVGKGAMLMNRAFREWGAAMNRSALVTGRKPMFIFINQVREKPGVLWGSPETVPGGKHQLFAPSLIVRIRSKTPDMSKGTIPRPLRWNNAFTVEKSKVGPPKLKGEYQTAAVSFDGFIQGDVLDFDTVLKFAKETEVLVQDKKKWVYTPSGLVGLKKEYRVQGDAVEDWIKDKALYDKVKRIVLRRALLALS